MDRLKEEAMDEMYRMLGREHEADLEREAHSRRLAATVRSGRQAPAEALEDAWLDHRSWSVVRSSS